MEYDSESSCEGRLRDIEASKEHQRVGQTQQTDQHFCTSSSVPWHSLCVEPAQPQTRLKLRMANKTLSSQVMEYYQKYSQNSNLDQYFSLPTSAASPDSVKYYYSFYELNPKLEVNRQDCVGEEYGLRSYVPRERRRWVRPPLIGQSSSTDTSSRYVQPLTDRQTPSPDLKRATPDTIPEEKNESQETLPEVAERKASSPTSSIASHKPLEWDSGADVGYYNTLPHNKKNIKKLSTIERMALARGCSAALRLDPEGTTESGISTKAPTVQKSNSVHQKLTAPNANSTPLMENVSGSESEIEITPIVKSHLPGILTGSDVKSVDRSSANDSTQQEAITRSSRSKRQSTETPRSSYDFRVPSVKYPTEGMRSVVKQAVPKEPLCPPASPLKKSTSMNVLAAPLSKLSIKRSQSELNLNSKDKNKGALPLLFNSTSSIATVVNKPVTCDKVIQTSPSTCTQESIGVQVSVVQEDRPPLPKRGTSLQKTLHSILKNSSGTYKVQNSRKTGTNEEACASNRNQQTKKDKLRRSGSEISLNRSTSVSPQPDDTENVTGKANSFEYFPGHIYENVPNGSDSHVSSVDTGRSNSTLPNTSSSINEKLWGDSDSLVRDLERSVNILKTLVDANKCDKQVKKRLIHHVVKRLVTAKYTDDKIEHNLEDNVPWNPDDARRKVYRTEILQALATKHSATDSSDDWKPCKKGDRGQKLEDNDREIMEEVALDSSNSDKFDRNTDRTEMDGRKARMGLRTDDCQRCSDTPTDPEQSASSDCFYPQRGHKSSKVKNIFCLKEKRKLPHGESTTTNSTPPDRNRMLLDAVVNNRRTPVESSDNMENNIDWRLPTTLSERQFELKKCSNSDSGDSKLVSYAEMEKRNQLIWITNEISHLCNLKKLLEQPRKLERPKSSPRKTKPASFKQKPLTALPHMRDRNKEADRVDSAQRNGMNEQWSSHCNLASTEISNAIQRTRKRNSCSQTATDSTPAHSKTGGEVVSTIVIRCPAVTLISIGVQTSPCASAPPSSPSRLEFARYIECPVHKRVAQLEDDCTCADKACRCERRFFARTVQSACKCRAQGGSRAEGDESGYRKPDAASDHLREERTVASRSFAPDRAIANGAGSFDEKEGDRCKQKETKNQINASKSRDACDCACVAGSKRELNGVGEKRGDHRGKRAPADACQLCSRPVCTAESARECERSRKRCGCAHGCRCANARPDALCRRDDDGRPSARADERGLVEACRCESERARNGERDGSASCECRSSDAQRRTAQRFEHRSRTEERARQAKSRRPSGDSEDANSKQPTVQTSPKCNCSKDCSCASGRNDQEDLCRGAKSGARSSSAIETSDSDRSCGCCRSCGTVYRNATRCGCRQSYPKAVAYELSFANENDRINDASSVDVLPKVPLANTSKNAAKPNGCACEASKRAGSVKNSQQPNTLQDYLSRNKPDFVGNAETRRQYMSEISHLRQLRKEKRIQLLAMASTSNVNKSPKACKPSVCVQRKISDEEMKERLRKRYLRLSEVRLKRRQQERQEEARRNKLMAKIFCKKLQQKVLRGQVDLSQSVSVISNI